MRTRRHHNNYGKHQIKKGAVSEQIKKIAKKLKIKFSEPFPKS